MKTRRRHARKAKPILKWTIGLYLLAQIAAIIFIDWGRPGWVDHQYGWNLRELRQRQSSGAQSVVVMGNSRTVAGFIPQWTEPITLPSGEKVIACNFAHTSGGPLMNLVELRRLLRDGEKPGWLILEMMPGLLNRESATNTRDLAVLGDFPASGKSIGWSVTAGRWIGGRYDLFYRYRQDFAWEYLPSWVPDEHSEARAEHRDRRGARWSKAAVWERPRLVEIAKGDYFKLVHTYNISPQGDRALREIFDLCKERGIKAALLWAPEGKEFQSWYTLESSAAYLKYMQDVAGAYGVPMIDARNWLADIPGQSEEELFLDSHHLKEAGAKVYTRLFYDNALKPFVLDALK